MQSKIKIATEVNQKTGQSQSQNRKRGQKKLKLKLLNPSFTLIVVVVVVFLGLIGAVALLLGAVVGGVPEARANGVWFGPEALFDGKRPHILIRPTDGAVVVLAETDSSILYASSTDGYNPNVVYSDGQGQPVRVRGTFDASGNLHTVWMNRDHATGAYHNFYAIISPSGAVGAIRDLSTELGHSRGVFGDIAVSPVDGHLYLAQEVEGAQVGVVESDDGGAHWSNWKVLGQGVDGNTGTRVAVDSHNIVHFIYEDSHDVIAVERVNGVWSAPVQVDNLGTPGHRSFWPSIAVDKTGGNAYVAWQEDGVSGGIGGPQEISFARFDGASGKWQPEIRNISQTDASGPAALVPAVAVNNPSNSSINPIASVWVAWETSSSGNSYGGARSTFSTDGGLSFRAAANNASLTPNTAASSTSGSGNNNNTSTANSTTTASNAVGNVNIITDETFTRNGPWDDLVAGNGQVYWSGQLADGDGSTYEVWLAATTALPGTGTGTVSLFPPGSSVTPFMPPTPTAPGFARPNLHLYLKDAAGSGISGARLTVYQYQRNPLASTSPNANANVTTGAGPGQAQRTLTTLATATTDGSGRADFDAMAFAPGQYFLEMYDSGGNLILPHDPGLPASSGDLGNPDPQTAGLTVLNLTRGAVVYVNDYVITTATNNGSHLVAQPNSEKDWLYYPPSGSQLSQISPIAATATTSGTGVAAVGTYVPIATPTPAYGGYGGISAVTLPAGFTAVAGGGVIGGVESADYGLTPHPNAPPPPPANYTPLPTPTLDCGNGCINSNNGGSRLGNSEAIAQATFQAQTVVAKLTAGILQPGGGGFRGSGSTPDQITSYSGGSNSSATVPPATSPTMPGSRSINPSSIAIGGTTAPNGSSNLHGASGSSGDGGISGQLIPVLSSSGVAAVTAQAVISAGNAKISSSNGGGPDSPITVILIVVGVPLVIAGGLALGSLLKAKAVLSVATKVVKPTSGQNSTTNPNINNTDTKTKGN